MVLPMSAVMKPFGWCVVRIISGGHFWTLWQAERGFGDAGPAADLRRGDGQGGGGDGGSNFWPFLTQGGWHVVHVAHVPMRRQE
eukprot:6422356-Pyramimonas_sp.AAC.1